MREAGYTLENKEYYTLLSIFNFIVNYAQHYRDKAMESNDQPVPIPFSKRQTNWLLLQIKALEYLQRDSQAAQRLPIPLMQALQSIYNRSDWDRNTKKTQMMDAALGPVQSDSRNPCVALNSVLCGRFKPRLPDIDFLRKERDRLVEAELNERKEHLTDRKSNV